MEELDHFLNKFKQSLGRDVSEREAVAEVIHKLLGFQVRLEDVSVKGDTIHIKTTPPKKSEIRLRETDVLSEARKKTNLNLKRILYN